MLILCSMVISIAGDSITAGNLGVPFTKLLELPAGSSLSVHGVDGDTVKGVSGRLQDILKADNPDVLVIEAGANDILIPEMSKKGGEWNSFVENMASIGSVPLPLLEDFHACFSNMIAEALEWGVERILCLTILPLGENLNSNLNKKRRDKNECIRRAVFDAGVELLDTADIFDKALQNFSEYSDWLFSSPSEFITDLRRMRREGGANVLSRERGLHLTMDGAHLNEEGAGLLAGAVSAAF